MTATVAGDITAPRSRPATATIAPAVAVAGLTSIGAGAIHAAAMGAHAEHNQAVVTFAIVALVQIAWGIYALLRPGRVFLLVGAAINAALVGGWILAKTNGISFVDGLDVSESPQFADTLAATFAGIAVIGAVLGATALRAPKAWFNTAAFTGVAVVTALVTTFGMVSAGSHAHGGHDEAGAATTGGHSHGTGDDHGVAVVATKPYDPTQPIDLGGTPGVTPEQQARAENLIAITLARLPKYADYRAAEADGFVSIGDGVTGFEHFVNTSYFNDDHFLDPDYPESVVYKTDRQGNRTLAAAMFMMNTGTTLADVPDVGGSLMQWHIHDNLCFNAQGKVAGLRAPGGACREGTGPGGENPMIHVWIVPHECGPFSALEGIGGGTIAAGETRLCDTAHGSGAHDHG